MKRNGRGLGLVQGSIGIKTEHGLESTSIDSLKSLEVSLDELAAGGPLSSHAL